MNSIASFFAGIMTFVSLLFGHHVPQQQITPAPIVKQASTTQEMVLATNTTSTSSKLLTYSNNFYGYELQYPESWKIRVESNNNISILDPKIKSKATDVDESAMLYLSVDEADSLDSWYNTTIVETAKTVGGNPIKKNITIDGNEALDVQTIAGTGNGVRYVAVYKNKKVFYFRDNFMQNYSTDKNNLISSFKFTKDNNENTSLIYKNAKYGFILTFPEQWKEYKVSSYENSVLFGIKDQAAIFTIVVHSKKEQEALHEELRGGSYLSENKDYVFTAVSAQDYTDSVAQLATLRNQILASFKLPDAIPTAGKNSYAK